MKKVIRIGVSSGDINGIGLEVTLKALYGMPWPADQKVVLIGNSAIIQQQCRKFRLPCPESWNPAQSKTPDDPVVIWDSGRGPKLKWKPGKLDPTASRAAAEWIKMGAQACLDHTLDALVTAPISKEGFHAAGINTPGHTELLAGLTGAKRYAMMLFGGPLRVVLATRHISLASVPASITRRLIVETATITSEALEWMGVRRKRIAICGLNPHAGEGGDLGTEEITIIAPAIRDLRKKGLDVHGPLPGDTVFHQVAAGDYDAVIAMYHDQGLAPLKLVAFDSGVNVTLGLPIVRTSPDHGTAFNIAGKNLANPSSMTEAIVQARQLAMRKNPWAKHSRS